MIALTADDRQIFDRLPPHAQAHYRIADRIDWHASYRALLGYGSVAFVVAYGEDYNAPASAASQTRV